MDDPKCGSLAFQRLAAIIVALLDFSYGVESFAGRTILVFDIGGNLPMLVAQQVQHLRDGGVAFAEGQVGAVVFLAVLDVQCDDVFVLLAKVRHRIAARGGEVADVQIDADVF
jgi:hypothetical protein